VFIPRGDDDNSDQETLRSQGAEYPMSIPPFEEAKVETPDDEDMMEEEHHRKEDHPLGEEEKDTVVSEKGPKKKESRNSFRQSFLGAATDLMGAVTTTLDDNQNEMRYVFIVSAVAVLGRQCTRGTGT